MIDDRRRLDWIEENNPEITQGDIWFVEFHMVYLGNRLKDEEFDVEGDTLREALDNAIQMQEQARERNFVTLGELKRRG